MSLVEKAEQEINSSRPYLILLSKKNTSKNIRKALIKSASFSFYSVLRQLTRHIINKTITFEKILHYKNSLYILALPTTKKKDVQGILEKESYDFF